MIIIIDDSHVIAFRAQITGGVHKSLQLSIVSHLACCKTCSANRTLRCTDFTEAAHDAVITKANNQESRLLLH